MGGGNASIHSYMQQYFRDFMWFDADILNGGAQVQGQFFTTQRRENGDGNKTPGTPVQVWPRPDRTPGHLRDNALEVGIELCCARQHSLNRLASKHLFAHLHTGIEA